MLWFWIHLEYEGRGGLDQFVSTMRWILENHLAKQVMDFAKKKGIISGVVQIEIKDNHHLMVGNFMYILY